MHALKDMTDQEIGELLREHGIGPTRQRVAVALALFHHWRHVSADDVYVLVNRNLSQGEHRVSKATVYNTLGLFARKGVVREIIVDPTRVFYDPNTSPHHHFYDVESGELTDIDEQEIRLDQLPVLPEGARLHGVDVVIRVSRRADS